MNCTERIEIDGDMPLDKSFDGGFTLCHCTGYEVRDEDGEWWFEYEDSEGNLHYGR